MTRTPLVVLAAVFWLGLITNGVAENDVTVTYSGSVTVRTGTGVYPVIQTDQVEMRGQECHVVVEHRTVPATDARVWEMLYGFGGIWMITVENKNGIVLGRYRRDQISNIANILCNADSGEVVLV